MTQEKKKNQRILFIIRNRLKKRKEEKSPHLLERKSRESTTPSRLEALGSIGSKGTKVYKIFSLSADFLRML
jgi:hypothetical protein